MNRWRNMEKSTKRVLIIAGVPLALMFVLFVLTVYQDHFFIYIPRECGWMSLSEGLHFEGEPFDHANVTDFDSLVFRQSSQVRNRYFVTALSTYRSDNGWTVYASPQYSFLTNLPWRASVASNIDWQNAKPANVGDSFNQMVERRPELQRRRTELEALEVQTTGQTIYPHGSENVSPELNRVALPSHTDWYGTSFIWSDADHGLVFWDAFDLSSRKKLFTVAALFLAMGGSSALGDATWLPGGVLVISPPGRRKRLLVCKAH